MIVKRPIREGSFPAPTLVGYPGPGGRTLPAGAAGASWRAVAGGRPRSRYILGLGLLRCAADVTWIIVALLSRDLFYDCDKHHIFTQDPVIILTIDRSICPPQ